MKKAVIIFLILYALTLAVPAVSCINPSADSNTRELVTLLMRKSKINIRLRFHLPFKLAGAVYLKANG